MADLAAADLAALVTFIETEFDDAANLYPDSTTLATMVASIAPRCVEQLNAYGRTTLGRDGLVLAASVLEFIKIGLACNILRDAYRPLPSNELDQVEMWCSDWRQVLEDAASGKLDFTDTTDDDTARTAASSSEPRMMTTDSDFAEAGASTGRKDLGNWY